MEIQAIAIDALTDRDHDVVESAVEALTLVGDDLAKAALFERLHQWHAKWIGRQRDIAWISGDGPITDDRYLGDNLIRSIATGAGWLLSEQDQQLLLQSAITENQEQQVSQFVGSAKNGPITITIFDTAAPHIHISVAQYNYEDLEPAKRKLSQFPRGTNFLLQHISSGGDDAQKATLELQSFLEQHAMRVSVLKPQ